MSRPPTAPTAPVKEWRRRSSSSRSPRLRSASPIDDETETFPGGERSLSGTSLHAFLLGQAFSSGIFLSLVLHCIKHSPLWRIPLFVSCLALFHFLEFFITARYNHPAVSIASFLLSNGSEYTIAHVSAMLECIVTRLLLPEGYFSTISLLFGGVHMQACIGILLIIVGQVARTWAMIDAGTNFNHQVQTERQEGHELVSNGIYKVMRHPSYFGFFWWGIGTQLMFGNTVCLVGYAFVLWRFFAARIKREFYCVHCFVSVFDADLLAGEEQALVAFFGNDYVKYRERTLVGIPGIS
ncbi:hypothetical protein KEM56_006729 [Ascosphaera pollenicola]|nr:hypothetical protein KEM56_006729 [Ascosphaera pollenicola]